MRVGLIGVDGHNYPNLALMKISAWHKFQGDTVDWYDGFTYCDRVYMSRVFDDTYTHDDPRIINAGEVIKGGTGYGVNNWLPDEIEHIMPDYALYGIADTAYGFLTRGCPRACGFCIVADKEGSASRKVADLSEWWSGQPKIELMDPNLLACPQHMELLEQLVASKAVVYPNQGLDIRLTTPQNIALLNKMRIKRLHFAWDNPDDDLRRYFERFTELYSRKSPSGKVVYVLTNYNSTMQQNLHRIYALRDLGYDPYVMVYDKPNAPREIKRLQRWCNNRLIYRSCTRFEDYKP